MLKNRWISALLAASLMLGTASCDKFLDVNANVDDPTTTTSNLRLPAVQGMLATTFYEQLLTTSYFSQYRTGLWGTSLTIDKWDYSNVNRIGAWRRHYFDTGGNAMDMIKRAEQDGDHNYAGVGKVLLAYSTLMATDMFGDMPLKEAYQGNVNPRYDSQEEVYASIHAYLDQALEHFKQVKATNLRMGRKEDPIYGGDLGRWEAFAHAIKARAYLHTAKKLGTGEQALQEVELAKPMFADALWSYSSDPAEKNGWKVNPLSAGKPRPQWDHVGNDLDGAVPTAFFIGLVKSPSEMDPRLDTLMLASVNSKTEGSTTPAFQGAPSSEGIGSKSRQDFPQPYEGYWTRMASQLPLLLREELSFIEAELAFAKGDKNKAYAAYQEGVDRNMKRLGVKPDELAAYTAGGFYVRTANDLTLSDIMKQKYVALYLAPESWVDMRRHNYSPEVYTGLTYPKNSKFAAADKLSGRWISRMIYDPQTEYIYNLPEIQRLGAQADDWVVKKMWWQE